MVLWIDGVMYLIIIWIIYKCVDPRFGNLIQNAIEYDQELSQSHTKNQPTAPRGLGGKATKH